MSKWTYVIGTVKVDTFSSSSAEAMFIAQTVVNHLPKITGSERDVEYYFNLIKGPNTSSTFDDFGCHTNLYKNFYEYQSEVLVTFQGSLRDREFEETLKEVTKTVNRLSKRLWVNECSILVYGNGKKYEFSNPNWMLINDSNWTTNWFKEKLKNKIKNS